MSDESYRKCKTCRFCIHSSESWNCGFDKKAVSPMDGCERYRPGCCENCTCYSDGFCSLKKEERYELDVCIEYDPAGSIR